MSKNGFLLSCFVHKTENVPIFFKLLCADQLHSVPIAQMGNYQDFLKAAPQPLRDADPEQPKRLHTFGNPFKLDKKVADSYFVSSLADVR